ncbi:AI-2E family transporter [Paramaledivibacter caminithermalis]|jgi:predicted PurR-regulated permease PerM|uniref:Predicted PurR-regulated permease PerM n=1 Tax=Paramaledivibacter caminithermalis (strain DSM 15212 / CIP 107654 / DViRD3) TaxID=1121301 RepID=A0A1M6JT36_PARC5|nr:AI-2E family transporter [Paramaledivibacter caminithermalis]SHJ49885.1 Predicted PurR-regulated permease PerM [Paramaledivibacter caminithermalis DSM 15212]
MFTNSHYLILFASKESLNNANLFTKTVINILLFPFLIFLIYYLINIGNKYVVYRKKIKLNRKYNLIIILFIIVILLITLMYFFRNIIISILVPILWAIVIAYLINPLVNKLCELKLSRLWSVIIIYIGLILLLFIFSITIIPRITTEIKGFAETLPQYTNEAIKFFNKIYLQYLNSVSNLPPEFIGVEVAFSEYLNRIQMYIIDLFKNMTEKGLSIFSNIVGIILVPIYTFYFLKDTSYFKRKVLLSIPRIIRGEVISIFKDINKLLNNFIRGQLIVAAIVGILSIIALLILKVEFALLIGAIAGISNVIPYFGPIMGAIPGVAIALLDKPIKALWVIIAFFIIQQIESAIIQPKIVGDSVGLHPVFVIVSLLVGGELFGIAGLLFAVPIAASIRVVLNHIVKILVKI